MLLGILDAILLGNILAGKGMNRAEERIITTGYGNKKTKWIFNVASSFK